MEVSYVNDSHDSDFFITILLNKAGDNMNEKIYETHYLNSEPLPFIFHLDSISDTQPSFFNWHTNIELLYFTDGNGYVHLGEEKISVKTGDIVIINSNVAHSFTSDTWVEYYCLIPDREFCQTNAIDTNCVHFKSHIDDTLARELFEHVITEFSSCDLYRNAGIKNAVLALLIYLARNYTESVHSYGNISETDSIQFSIGYILANISENFTIEELAKKANLSKYHFIREFKKVTGDTPIVFVHKHKCEIASKMLKSGSYTIREVCEKNGFDSLSYFGKIFKRYIGSSPSEFLKKHR